MRAFIQRVRAGAVTIGDLETARIGRGYVIFLGMRHGDTQADAESVAAKCSALRVMEDASGKMNLSLQDVGGSALIISEFTLYGDTQKGNRPGFTDAASPEEALPLYETFVQRMKEHLGAGAVRTGEFRARMTVKIENEGPVTILVESPTSNNRRSISS